MKKENFKKIEKKAYVLLKRILKEQAKEKDLLRRYKRNELMRQILIGLAAGLYIPAALMIPNLPIALKPILRILAKKYKTTPQNFVKSIKNLKKQKLIAIREINNIQEVEITDKGKKQVLRYAIDYIKLPRKEKWDGKWRLIIFDIPKDLKTGRDALTKTLQKLGCYQLQKSVYVYPYPCKDEIDFISSIFEVYPYVIYLEANYIEEYHALLKHFNLNQ